jgi:CHAD domain-containing protein
LRSTLRRITAELLLLPASPKTTKQIARFSQLSRPIVKAAGRVRDLDVQAGLLEDLPRTLKPEADKLEGHLEKRRRRRFARLRQLLEDDHRALLKALNQLESLAPTNSVPTVTTDEPVPATFTPRDLAHQTFDRAAATLDLNHPDQLHQLRKAARDARYLAESSLKRADKTSPTARDAARFRQVQQDVGCWHDYLTLAETSRRFLSSASPLPPAIDRLRDRHYRSALKIVEATKRRNGSTPHPGTEVSKSSKKIT